MNLVKRIMLTGTALLAGVLSNSFAGEPKISPDTVWVHPKFSGELEKAKKESEKDKNASKLIKAAEKVFKEVQKPIYKQFEENFEDRILKAVEDGIKSIRYSDSKERKKDYASLYSLKAIEALDDVQDFPHKKVDYQLKVLAALENKRRSLPIDDTAVKKELASHTLVLGLYYMEQGQYNEARNVLLYNASNRTRNAKMKKEQKIIEKTLPVINQLNKEKRDLDWITRRANAGDSKSCIAVGKYLVSKGDAKGFEYFKKSKDKKFVEFAQSYDIVKKEVRETPRGLKETAVKDYQNAIKTGDNAKLYAALQQLEVEGSIRKYCKRLQTRINKKISGLEEDIKEIDSKLPAIMKTAKTAVDVNARIKLANLYKELFAQTLGNTRKRTCLEQGVEHAKTAAENTANRLVKDIAEGIEAKLADELKKVSEYKGIAVGLESGPVIPAGSVLYMTFDKDTIVTGTGIDPKTKKIINEGRGKTWYVKDLSGKGNHGEIKGKFAGDLRTGKPTVYRKWEDVLAEYDLALVKGQSGKANDYAMYFAGKKGWIEVADHDSLDFGISDFEISFFLNILNKNKVYIVDKRENKRGYFIPCNFSGECVLNLGISKNGVKTYWVATPNLLGKSANIIGNFDRDSRINVTIDGKQTFSTDIKERFDISNKAPLRIGYSNVSANYFGGKLDNLVIKK